MPPPLVYNTYDTNDDATVNAHVRGLFSTPAGSLSYNSGTGEFSLPVGGVNTLLYTTSTGNIANDAGLTWNSVAAELKVSGTAIVDAIQLFGFGVTDRLLYIDVGKMVNAASLSSEFAFGTGLLSINNNSISLSKLVNASNNSRLIGVVSAGPWLELSVTSPLAITSPGTLRMTQSNTSTNGWLSSTDWNTFNNKQNALTFPLAVNLGGTGVAAFGGTNTLLYTTSADTLASIATANTSSLVTNNSGVPSWTSGSTANRLLRTDGTTISFSQAVLTTDVTGVLPVGNGGTGTSTVFTQGSVVFAGASGVYSQNNSNLFWDNTNIRLGIGTNSLTSRFTVSENNTATNAGNYSMSNFSLLWTPTATDTTFFRAASNYEVWARGSNDISGVWGLRALSIGVGINGTYSGTVNSCAGFYSTVFNFQGGTISFAAAAVIASPIGGGTITNCRGIQIESQSVSGVGTAHAIYQAGASDRNYFNGRIGIGQTAPTARLHLPAGTTAASSSPVKFVSGSLMTAPEVGAVEFLTDKLHFTITTGTARKEITLNDAALTSGTFPVATTNGRLTDSSFTSTNLTSGTYTPTLTNVANLDASTAYQCQYMRVGNTVTVSGKVDVDPTAAATPTQLGISLPIASNIGGAEDCAGTGASPGIAGQSMAVVGNAANNRAELQWIAGDLTNQATYFTFTYQVI